MVPAVPPDDDGEVIDAELIEDPEPAPRSIVGMDSKVYPVKPVVTAPAKRRRRPLPDAYRDAIRDLTTAVERLQQLHTDDRFPGNRDGLLDRHRGDLVHVFSNLSEVMNDIGASPTEEDVRHIAATWAGTR